MCVCGGGVNGKMGEGVGKGRMVVASFSYCLPALARSQQLSSLRSIKVSAPQIGHSSLQVLLVKI